MNDSREVEDSPSEPRPRRSESSLENAYGRSLSPGIMGGFTTALNRGDSPHYRSSLVSLDHITLLDVLEPFDRQTAFIAGGHFPHIIFETFQTGEFAVVHDHMISQDSH